MSNHDPDDNAMLHPGGCPCPRCAFEPDPASPLDLDAFAGHTPGPWDLDRRGAKVAYLVALGCKLADLPWHRPGSADRIPQHNEQEANITLIAAAPALLAECRRLRAELESMRLAGRELAADLDAAESLIYRADYNLTDFGEVRKMIKRRRKEMAKEAKEAKRG